MNELFTFLQNIQPLGVIALLGVVIYMLVRNQKGQNHIAENHLSGLPEILKALERIEGKLDGKLEDISEGIVHIKARINGRNH